MTLFQELALVALVIITCAVCLCAHYLQIIISRIGDKGFEHPSKTGSWNARK